MQTYAGSSDFYHSIRVSRLLPQVPNQALPPGAMLWVDVWNGRLAKAQRRSEERPRQTEKGRQSLITAQRDSWYSELTPLFTPQCFANRLFFILLLEHGINFSYLKVRLQYF